MATVRLLSVKGRAQLIERFYFYDGEVPIVKGVVEVPQDRPEWVQRAYIMGYRHDPETEEMLTLDEALAGGKKTPVPYATAVEQESAESTGETDEGTDGGGQPAGEDGVRESEQPRLESVLEEGLDGGVGDGAAVEGSGDGTPADPV